MLEYMHSFIYIFSNVCLLIQIYLYDLKKYCLPAERLLAPEKKENNVIRVNTLHSNRKLLILTPLHKQNKSNDKLQ